MPDPWRKNTLATLTEYASEKKVEPRCGVCRLPEETLRQINDNERKALHQGRVSRRVVAEWASAETGVQVTSAMLDNHASRGHVA